MALGMLLAFLSFFLIQKKELQVYTYTGEDVPYNYFDEEEAQPITHMVKWIEAIPGIGSFLAPYQFAWRFTQMALVFGLMLGAYTFKNLDTVVKEGTKTAVLTTICILALITGSFSMEARMQGTTPMYVTGAGGLDTRLAVANGEYLPENTYAVMINRDRPEPAEGCIVTGFAKEKGVMTIKVYFKEPKLWRLTEMISIITAILLVIFLWKKKNKKGGL